MRRSLVPYLVLAFIILLPRTAAPWGNAPTHFSIGNDLVYAGILPASDNPGLFIRAIACPDLAWTPRFTNAGLSYIHTPEFAEALSEVGNTYSWRPNWRTIARAFRVHLIADEYANIFLANVDDTTHSLVEVSVDTIIYYEGSPIETPPLVWKNINVGYDACDPYLFIFASRKYRDETGQAVPTIQWWDMLVAVPELEGSIAAEYTYHELKGNTDLSKAYLQYLVTEKKLPGAFEDYYRDSVNAAAYWIQPHP